MMDAFIGEVRVFAVQRAVPGWLECDGREYDIGSYSDLFKVIGYRYGGSDGKFRVPHLGGRIPVGAGQGPGLTPYALGEQFGVTSVALTSAQMPAHAHQLATETGVQYPAMTDSPDGATRSRLVVNPAGALGKSFVTGPVSAADAVSLHAQSIDSAGEGKAHPNCHPYLTMQYRIAWQGSLPTA